MYKKFLFFATILIVLATSSCGNNSEEKEKVQKLEKEIEELKKQNKEPESKDNQSQSENETPKPKTIILTNSRYVFAKFDISYYAMSGINQESQYTDVGITNILQIDNYTEEVKYKLKDLIKKERILLTAPFAKNQKKLNIEIFDFKDYVSASKEREKIDYQYEISLSSIF